jgi:hypothetical protein
MHTKLRGVRWALAVPAAMLLLAIAATLTLAETQILNGKLRAGDVITVPAGETVNGDIYLAGGNITIDGNVDGDVVAVGGQVNVNGTVDGDVLVGAGTTNVAGNVTGDLRVAGGQVTVSGQVGEDLAIAGGYASLGSGAEVGGDLLVTGGTVSVAGTVRGAIEGNAGTYARSGPAPTSEHVVITQRGAQRAEPTAADTVFDGIRHFVTLVIFGALLIWLGPGLLRRSEETVRTQPLIALGGGVLALIGFAGFVIVLLLITILLAIALGLSQLGALAAVVAIAGVLALLVASFVFWLAVAYLADLVVGFALARLVMRDPSATANRWRELGLVVAGAAAVTILTTLPVIGGLAKLLIVLFGLGAVTVTLWRWWRGSRSPAAVPAGPDGPATI